MFSDQYYYLVARKLISFRDESLDSSSLLYRIRINSLTTKLIEVPFKISSFLSRNSLLTLKKDNFASVI